MNKFSEYEIQQLEKIEKFGYKVRKVPDPLQQGKMKQVVYNPSGEEIFSLSKKSDSNFPFQTSPEKCYQSIENVLEEFIPKYLELSTKNLNSKL